MCSISNEAVLKSLFKIKDNELTFARAIAVAVETEEAAKVAKETVYGSKPSSIHQILTPQRQKQQGQKGRTPRDFPKGTSCPRCGRKDHKAVECPYKDSMCHLQSVCLQKKRNQQQVKIIKHRIQTVKAIKSVPWIQQVIQVNNKMFTFEVDTGAGDNYVLKKLGRSWGNQGSHQPQVAMRLQMDTPFQHWEFSAFQWYSRTAQVPACLLHSLSPRFLVSTCWGVTPSSN